MILLNSQNYQGGLLLSSQEFAGMGLFVSTPPSSPIRAQTANTVLVDNAATTPTAINSEVRLGGSSGPQATIISVTGTGPYTINFTFPRTTAQQFSDVGYVVHVTVYAETTEAAAIPYLPPATRDYFTIDEGQAVFDDNESVFFGDDAPGVTGAQYVHDLLTDGGYDVAISAEGYVTLTNDTNGGLVMPPTTDQTFTGYKITSTPTAGDEFDFVAQFEPDSIVVLIANMNRMRR